MNEDISWSTSRIRRGMRFRQTVDIIDFNGHAGSLPISGHEYDIGNEPIALAARKKPPST